MKHLTIILFVTLFACEKPNIEPQETKTQYMTDTTRNDKLNHTKQIKYVFEANTNIVEGVYRVNDTDYTFCGQGTEFSFEFEASQEQRLEIGARIKDKEGKQVRLGVYVDSSLVAEKIITGKNERVYRFGSVEYKLKNDNNDTH